jgi:predicted AlkP superfamily phosphohydrolase/phosphomutase
MSRVLVIGWDGADWRILDPLLERGALPNLQALIARGGRGVLRSTIPTHSWTAWPSFLTGVEPADHGVYDILESRGSSKRQFPVTFRSIKERTFLADLTRAKVETVALNIPLTFPAPAISGKLIAGGVLPKRRPFTHPESLEQDLAMAGVPWPINGMSWTTYRGRPDAFADECAKVVSARLAGMEHVLDTTDWRVAVCVFFATDRIQHCLSQYLSSDHPEFVTASKTKTAEHIRDVYRQLDEGLGSLVSRTGPDDLVVFMSDHGFQSCTNAVNMDKLLERLGFLEFSASQAIFGPMQWGPVRTVARKAYDMLGLHGKVSLPQPVNWSKTRAYTSVRSTGEGINVNLAGRESDGIVDPGDFETLRDRIADAVGSFVDPRTGAKPVLRVWRREELFKGKFADEAPDLLLEPSPRWSLTHAKSAVEPADWMSGDHRIEGVLAAAGPNVAAGPAFPEMARLVDLAPTILATVGAQPSVHHSGTVLRELVGEDAAVAAGAAPLAAAADGDGSEAGLGLDDMEADEVEEHLRGLGYIE